MQREERNSVVLENNGQKIFGVYHKPVGLQKYPAVLICHGLGGNKCGKYRIYVVLSSMLSALGIASLRIDFRGSGDSEGEFAEMTLEGEVSDALKGLEFLTRDPAVDQSRMGIFGRSFGGTIAVLAASRFSNIKSLAMWAPIFSGNQWIEKWNFVHAHELTDEHRENMMRINGQIPGYEFFKQLFSLQLEKDFQSLNEIPFLHIYGEKDAIVDTSHANDYSRLRLKAKGQNKFLRLPQSDHDFSHPQEQKLALHETCDWFVKTLKEDTNA